MLQVPPKLYVFVDDHVIQRNETIYLIDNSTSSNRTYSIACASINSRPGIDLQIALIDSNNNTSVISDLDPHLMTSCNALGLCSKLLEVYFVVSADYFNATSLSCIASNKSIRVLQTETRKVFVGQQMPTIITTSTSTLPTTTTTSPLTDYPIYTLSYSQTAAFLASNYTLTCPYSTPDFWASSSNNSTFTILGWF